jgi:predicted ribonuclease YlaK
MAKSCELVELTVPQKVIDRFWESKRYTRLPEAQYLPINSYVILRTPGSRATALCKHVGDGTIVQVTSDNDLRQQRIAPRDARQRVLMDSFIDEDVLLSVGLGAAGTGKTTLAMAYAIEQHQREGKAIFMTKPVVLVQDENKNHDAFGPVPGGVNEKFAPHLASYRIVLTNILGRNSKDYVEVMERKGHIQFLPLEYTRGCTFENCTFVCDEAQNLSWHQIKSLVSRIGKGGKIILLGDIEQIDTGLDARDTGLWKLIHSDAFADSTVTSGMKVKKQYRGPLPELVSQIDKELSPERYEEELD